MESVVTITMLAAVLLFSLATAVLIEEMIFGGLCKVVLTKMGQGSTK